MKTFVFNVNPSPARGNQGVIQKKKKKSLLQPLKNKINPLILEMEESFIRLFVQMYISPMQKIKKYIQL